MTTDITHIFFYIFALFVILGAVFLFRKRPSAIVMQAVEQAKESGDASIITTAIQNLRKTENSTLWDMAISELWRSHSRAAAADLIVSSITLCDADVLHYWAEKMLEVEPELATLHFSQTFLEEQYRPIAAASCGRFGCGSC